MASTSETCRHSKVKWVVVLLSLCGLASACVSLPGKKRPNSTGDRQQGHGVQAARLVRLDSGQLDLLSPLERRTQANYYYMLGEYLLQQGEWRRSELVFHNAYLLNRHPSAGGRWMAVRLQLEPPADLLDDLRRLILYFPKHSDMHMLYAHGLLRAGLTDQSLKHFEKAVELNPPQSGAYLAMIQIAEQNKQWSRAIVLAKEFSDRLPQEAAAHLILGRLYLAQKQYDLALPAAQKAYLLNSRNPEVIVLYALALEYNGKSKQSIRLYESLYAIDPGNPSVVNKLISLYRSVGGLDQALKLLNELIEIEEAEYAQRELDSEKSEAHDHAELPQRRPGLSLQKAYVLWELKRDQEALDVMLMLAESYPESGRVVFLTALGLIQVGRRVEALEFFEKVGASESFYQDARLRIAYILKVENRPAEALAEVEKLLLLDKVPWEVFHLKASILAEQKRLRLAVSFLRSEIKRVTEPVRAWFLIGVYEERLGRVERAVGAMKKVLALDPQHSSALNFIGYVYAERGIRLDEAEDYIRKALKIKPNDGSYLDSLGWVYFQRGDYAKAKSLLLRALEKEPEQGVILEHVGDVEAALGNPVAARNYYQKALSKDLNERDRKRIQKKFQRYENRGGA